MNTILLRSPKIATLIIFDKVLKILKGCKLKGCKKIDYYNDNLSRLIDLVSYYREIIMHK
jgi:hypothetical protein